MVTAPPACASSDCQTAACSAGACLDVPTGDPCQAGSSSSWQCSANLLCRGNCCAADGKACDGVCSNTSSPVAVGACVVSDAGGRQTRADRLALATVLVLVATAAAGTVGLL